MRRDPLQEFSDKIAQEVLSSGKIISKDSFIEHWNEIMKPSFASGEMLWECSPKLREHLLKIANDSND